LKKLTAQSVRHATARLQKSARIRADDEARRIPWQRLLNARNQYIDWQEFQLWVRSILEVEGHIPDWLIEIVNDRCPGFLESDTASIPKAAKTRPLALRLEDWIDENVFRFAKQEGWFNAITYYAIRDLRYQRAEVCWSECVEKWKKAKPISYPSFEEWQALAAQCDETAHLTARERKARASAKLVHPDRLSAAAARYMDCEALGYWARHALEHGTELPPEVVLELERRLPGYLQAASELRARTQIGAAQDWEPLMLWVAEQFFQDAMNEGWFDALLIQKRIHPRAIRTKEFSDHCSELWGSAMPNPYPSFEGWRKEADSYVDLDD
jgi:hypothetical protein